MRLFESQHLVEPPGMAGLAGEAGRHEGGEDLGGESRTDDTRAQAEHIEVVMLNRLVRRVTVVADRGANTGNLVRGNRNAGAAPAHEHATVGAPIEQSLANSCGRVGVVDRVRTVGPEVEHVVPGPPQQGGKFILHLITGVVGAKG